MNQTQPRGKQVHVRWIEAALLHRSIDPITHTHTAFQPLLPLVSATTSNKHQHQHHTMSTSDSAAACSRQEPGSDGSSSGKRCLPCEGGLPAVTPERLAEGLASLPLWAKSEDGTRISRAFVAKNFVEALAFFNAVGEVAEKEGVSPRFQDRQAAASPCPDDVSLGRVAHLTTPMPTRGDDRTAQHHPDLHLTGYRNVEVVLWTHAAGGLTENDLIMAGLIDAIPVAYSPKWRREHPEAKGTAKK